MRKVFFLAVVLYGITPIAAEGFFENQEEVNLYSVDFASFHVMAELTFVKRSKLLLPYELHYSMDGDKTVVKYSLVAIPKELAKTEFYEKYNSGVFTCSGSNNALLEFAKMFLKDPRISEANVVMISQK